MTLLVALHRNSRTHSLNNDIAALRRTFPHQKTWASHPNAVSRVRWAATRFLPNQKAKLGLVVETAERVWG